MGDKTGIAWTDATWNPIRGCTRVSEGCRHCYAELVAARFSGPGQAYEGLATLTPSGARWTGKLTFVEKHLVDPVNWKRPRRIFVNSMSDLFHDAVPDAWIDRVVGIMSWTPRHTFQILTKRPERMKAYSAALAALTRQQRGVRIARSIGASVADDTPGGCDWPLPNVHLGVSVEDQATADERIPALLSTPAAVRWVSYEPALGPVDFKNVIYAGLVALDTLARPVLVGHPIPHAPDEKNRNGLDWIVVGGESGPGARPFNLAWARSTVEQCHAAGVPVFVKQLGAWPIVTALSEVGDARVSVTTPLERGAGAEYRLLLRDRKGGDMAEWPEDLRVQEFPR